MATFSKNITVTAAVAGGTGPAASGGTLANVDFSAPLAPTVHAELFGAASGALLDNTFTLMADSGVQAAAQTLNLPLFRMNAWSGQVFTLETVFANGVNSPDWSSFANFTNNLDKIVPRTATVIGNIGFDNSTFSGAGSYSVADFATTAQQYAQFLGKDATYADGTPLGIKYYEIFNEPGYSQATLDSYVQAAADAIHKNVDSSFVVCAPVSANDFTMASSTIADGGSARVGMGDVHRYYYCPGDTMPSDFECCSATYAANAPEDYAASVDAIVNANTWLQGKPWLLGEYNLICAEGNGAADARMQTYIGSCFAASYLFKMQRATTTPMWATVWDFCNDGNYGLIQQINGSVISYQGYLLSQCAKWAPGRMTTANDASGSCNVFATYSGTHATVVIVNYDTNSVSGTVALSKWPANNTGNATMSTWLAGSTTGAAGQTGTVTVTNGVTGTITIPGQTVMLLHI